jgi:hypothetical protein
VVGQHTDRITRTVDLIHCIVARTALSEAEMQVLGARFADSVNRYAADPETRRRLVDDVFMLSPALEEGGRGRCEHA